MHRVHQRQDAVERDLLGDFVVHEEGGRHRRGIGQAAGLDQDMVEALGLLQQLLQDAHEVGAHIDHAADAAVGHLVDLFVGGHHQVGIDIDLAELVLDHGDAVAVLLRQDVVEQRRLARAEEAGKDGDRDGRLLCDGRCVHVVS
ncbi:hypothetical protein D3C72_1725440 [compost metagenome]